MIALSIILFLSHLAEIPYRSALRGWDNSFYFFWVRSAVIDGDWDFANDLAEANTIADKDQDRAAAMPKTEIGLIPNKYGIGWGLLTLPWFLAADLLVRALNTFGLSVARDGFGPIYQIICLVGHFLYAFIGLYFAFQVLRRFFPTAITSVTLLAIWSGSPLIFYQTINLGMSHNLVFGLTALSLYLAFRIRDQSDHPSIGNWLLLGATAGTLIIVRYPAGLYLLLPLAIVLPSFFQDPISRKQALLSIPAFLAPIAAQMVAWKQVFGKWIVFSYGLEDKGFSWTSPKLWEILFSANHGFFYWHPLLLLGFAGFCIFFFPRYKIWAWGLLSFGLMTYLNASWSSWNLASSFGYRGLEIGWIIGLIGLASLLQFFLDRPVPTRVILGLCLFLGLWNLNLSILYRFEVVSRNGPVTYEETLSTSASFYPQLIHALLEGESIYDWEPPERKKQVD